jgi:hypothetical protein
MVKLPRRFSLQRSRFLFLASALMLLFGCWMSFSVRVTQAWLITSKTTSTAATRKRPYSYFQTMAAVASARPHPPRTRSTARMARNMPSVSAATAGPPKAELQDEEDIIANVQTALDVIQQVRMSIDKIQTSSSSTPKLKAELKQKLQHWWTSQSSTSPFQKIKSRQRRRTMVEEMTEFLQVSEQELKEFLLQAATSPYTTSLDTVENDYTYEMAELEHNVSYLYTKQQLDMLHAEVQSEYTSMKSLVATLLPYNNNKNHHPTPNDWMLTKKTTHYGNMELQSSSSTLPLSSMLYLEWNRP